MRTNDTETSRDREDNRHLPAPKLFLFAPGSPGCLKLPLPDGSEVTVWLHARFVKILLILNKALEMDADLDEQLRGYLNDRSLAEQCPLGDPHGYTPEPQTTRAYRAQINRCIREQTPPGRPPPRLFHSERLVGVRLVRKIEIVDLSDRRKR